MKKEEYFVLSILILVFTVIVLTFINFELRDEIVSLERRLDNCSSTYSYFAEKCLPVCNSILNLSQGGRAQEGGRLNE